MNKFYLFNIFLIVLFIIIVNFRLYNKFNFSKKINENISLEDIKNEILSNLTNLQEEHLLNIEIEKIIDFYQDQEKELLVSLNGNGIAVNNYLLFKIENNKPKLIKFKSDNGQKNILFLTQGSGGAGRYGFDFKIIPEQGLIFLGNYYAYNTFDDICSGYIYIYNKDKALLEFNKELSEKYQKEYCSEICKNVPIELKEYFIRICQ